MRDVPLQLQRSVRHLRRRRVIRKPTKRPHPLRLPINKNPRLPSVVHPSILIPKPPTRAPTSAQTPTPNVGFPPRGLEQRLISSALTCSHFGRTTQPLSGNESPSPL